MKLPKSLIKKYGISKKAWSVFKGHKTRSRGVDMARRKHYSRRRSGFGGISFKGILLGVGIGAAMSMFGVKSPLLQGAASYFVGGIPAVIGSVGVPMLLGGGLSTSNSNWYG